MTIALVATLAIVTLAWFAWLSLSLAPSLIVRVHNGTEALSDQAPQAHGLLAELATRAGIGRPQLYVFKSPRPNGFVVASSHVQAVVVTEAVFDHLSPDQLRGLFALLTACLARRAARTETAIVAIALGLSSLLLPSWALTRWALPSRRWYDIDRAAAVLVGSDAVAAALAALAAAPADALDIRVPAACPLYCVDPANTPRRFASSSASHPPTPERIVSVRRSQTAVALSPAGSRP